MCFVQIENLKISTNKTILLSTFEGRDVDLHRPSSNLTFDLKKLITFESSKKPFQMRCIFVKSKILKFQETKQSCN